MSLLEKTRDWYGRYERPISSFSLVFGFVFDAITLKRVDTLWENLWILGHLLILGIFIILIHYKDNEIGDEKNPSKAHFWYVNILQFFFGGTLSTFLVFYFRSTDIWTTWPFILILVLAFIANESFKKHYVRLSFQISLFFLSVYSFSIFIIPVILHRISTLVFLISGIMSLVFIEIFILILFRITKDKLKESKIMTVTLVVGIFALVNLLYFTNFIPPIPLSLKDAGVYHSIEKNVNGNYVVTSEDHGWRGYFKLHEDYNKLLDSPIYFYSAIFSPRGLNLNIIHEWQYYDRVSKKWITDKTINLAVVGGRDGGFRTYSMRSNLNPGKWRVRIKTEQGQIIGHLRFNVVSVNTDPNIVSEVKK